MKDAQRRHQTPCGEHGKGGCLVTGELGRWPDHEADDTVPAGMTGHRAGGAVKTEQGLAGTVRAVRLRLWCGDHVEQAKPGL